MKLTSFTVFVSALESARVRYIVAGGLAVNAHGYLRFTKDVDRRTQDLVDIENLKIRIDDHAKKAIRCPTLIGA